MKKNTWATFREKDENKTYVEFHKFIKWYEEYLTFGGFPQVVLADDETQKRLYLKDIFTSYFEKDVRMMADFRQVSAFRDLLLLLMQRVGSKLDISKLASEIGISRETVYSYLAFLEGTYFIFLISPFSKNVDREVSGTKKVYVCDNGIINLFGKVSDGNLLENAVFQNIRKFGKVNYYQKRTGTEIDFILPDHRTALEVKIRGSEKEYSKLTKLSEALGMNECYVISQYFLAHAGIIPAQDV